MRHLWDVQIEDLHCGWEDLYQEALAKSEIGEIVTLDFLDKPMSFMYSPIQCKKILIDTFNDLKIKAKKYYNSDLKNSDNISRLIKCDMGLYSILFRYLLDDNVEYDELNPKTILRDLYDVGSYFEIFEECSFEFLKPYHSMRFIQIEAIDKI